MAGQQQQIGCGKKPRSEQVKGEHECRRARGNARQRKAGVVSDGVGRRVAGAAHGALQRGAARRRARCAAPLSALST